MVVEVEEEVGDDYAKVQFELLESLMSALIDCGAYMPMNDQIVRSCGSFSSLN